MKFSHATAVAFLAASVAAAPMPAQERPASRALVHKRAELEGALSSLEELKTLRAKRATLDADLLAREYAIVTEVLTAIKDTDLAPKVLEYFVGNDVLKDAAIAGVVLVVKLDLIPLGTLLTLLTELGLITLVVNSLIGDCQIYSMVLLLAEKYIGLLFKRDTPFTPEEGMALMRREGLVQHTPLSEMAKRSSLLQLEQRDIDDVVVSLLESLALSGLATQVVQTVLTDESFILFSAELVAALYADGLLKLNTLVLAIEESGIAKALFTDLFNIDLLKTIASAALSAFEGTCSSSTTTTLSSSLSSAASTSSLTSSSLLLSLLGGLGILSSVAGLVGSLFGGSGSSSSDTTVTTATATTATAVPVATAAVATTTATTAAAADPCALYDAKRKRMRLY